MEPFIIFLYKKVKDKIDMFDSHKSVASWLIEKVIAQELTLQLEQQKLLVAQAIINQSLALYYQLSGLKTFPTSILQELFFAIQSRDIQVILLLKIRSITY